MGSEKKKTRKKSSLDPLINDLKASVVSGHFRFTQNLHSDTYFDKNVLNQRPNTIMGLGFRSHQLRRESKTSWLGEASVVVAEGASIEFGFAVGVYNGFWFAYAEKAADGSVRFKRNFGKLLAGRKVVIAEDVLTTGGTVRKLMARVKEFGGETVGVIAICNRGKVTFHIPLYSFLNLDLNNWDPEKGECALCLKGIPLNQELGHGGDLI